MAPFAGPDLEFYKNWISSARQRTPTGFRVACGLGKLTEGYAVGPDLAGGRGCGDWKLGTMWKWPSDKSSWPINLHLTNGLFYLSEWITNPASMPKYLRFLIVNCISYCNQFWLA
jgi:hypothetical protein